MRGESTEKLLGRLEQEGDIPNNWRESLTNQILQSHAAGPWHTKFLMGLGAWLSSLLFIGFLSAVGMTTGGFGMYGGILLASCLILKQRKPGLFLEQGILACSLAGQAFVLVAFMKNSSSNELLENVSLVIIGFNLIWPFLLRTRAQAFLSMLFVAAGIGLATHAFHLQILLPWTPPLLFLVAASFLVHEFKFIKKSWVRILPALANGLVFGGFLLVSLSNLSVIDFMIDKQKEIYPLPWTTSILILLMLYFYSHRSKNIFFKEHSVFAYGVLFSLGGLSVMVPGLVFSMGVALIGALYFERVWITLGLIFSSLFCTFFIYGMEWTLSSKSLLLLGLGVIFFTSRKILNMNLKMRTLP